MLYRHVGFSSSWATLTRDRGWFKTLLMVALLAWIPIFGEIVVFGYGYEWARLTAWGVDAVPKQHNIYYRKVLLTGARTFLVTFSMRAALVVLPVLIFQLDLLRLPLPFFPLEAGSYRAYLLLDNGSGLLYPLLLIMLLLVGTFMSAAAMRATIYDQFGAGWRIDRLLQMIARDFAGFFRTCGVVLITSGISFASIVLTGFLSRIATRFILARLSLFYYARAEDMISSLFVMGFVPLLLLILITIAFAYGLSLLASVMQLVSINAMGQWFSGFEVNRWDVSSAPLPQDVMDRGPRAPEPPRAPIDPSPESALSQKPPYQPDAEAEPQTRQIPLAPIPGVESPGGSEEEPRHRV